MISLPRSTHKNLKTYPNHDPADMSNVNPFFVLSTYTHVLCTCPQEPLESCMVWKEELIRININVVDY